MVRQTDIQTERRTLACGIYAIFKMFFTCFYSALYDFAGLCGQSSKHFLCRVCDTSFHATTQFARRPELTSLIMVDVLFFWLEFCSSCYASLVYLWSFTFASLVFCFAPAWLSRLVGAAIETVLEFWRKRPEIHIKVLCMIYVFVRIEWQWHCWASEKFRK